MRGLPHKKSFVFSLLSLVVLSCGSSTDSKLPKFDTAGPIVCANDDDCKFMRIGPCTRGACSPQTHECIRRLIADGTVCDDSNACTDNDQCQSGSCKGDAVVCQQPSDSCQSASCQPEKGCVITKKTDGLDCDDSDPCTERDTCLDGHCQGRAMLCDDKLDCTTDTCSRGRCLHNLVTGYCEINEKCYKDGDSNPDNPCETCDVKISSTVWQPVKDGSNAGGTAICYHGKACNPVENCRVLDCGDDGCGGICGKCGKHYQCESGKCVFQTYCGDGICDATKNENCASCPADCACKDGVCYKSQCCKPDCNNKDCGDNKCGGSCWQGQGADCNDSLDCTVDRCVSDNCEHRLQGGYCAINRQCYVEDTQKIGDECLICDPSQDTTDWSNAPTTLVCDNASGRCFNGLCCIPDCIGRECGSDGCGGQCGQCKQGRQCVSNKCK